jgi:hypothetical protein
LNDGGKHVCQVARWLNCILLIVTNAVCVAAAEPQLAFPGAEGYGRFARGGRGGDVYHVTNLEDDGPGSLREGIRSATGPRTIVFDTSGTIRLKSDLVIRKSFLTIAGQTAPGDGICISDQMVQFRDAEHLIVRYLRLRMGDENKPRPAGKDCLNTNDVDHVIFDHLTVSWGIDANHDLRRGGNFTLQWSIYAEALHDSLHEKGPHAMLASFRDLTAGITLHHNLFASSRERHPTLGGSRRTRPDAIVDFRNNVIYNVHGATNLGNCRINVINNYYRPGPDSRARILPLSAKTENPGALRVFLQGNIFEGRPDLTADNRLAIDFTRYTTGGYLPTSLEKVEAHEPFDVGAARPHTDSAEGAFERVLAEAGASLRRDAADARLVAGVRDGTHRMINTQREVGGWPTLRSEPAPQDSDQDGMPDAWEEAHSLNPNDPADRNADADGDGYTNLEEYLNELVEKR